MTAPILVCTVGGSPDPIVAAIGSLQPAHVAFLATDDEAAGDGLTSVGSKGEIAKPGGIVERTRLPPGRFELRLVPADDPDRGYLVARDLLADLRRRFPDAEIVCDYTGGTKSMTAALMLAAVASRDDRLRIQFVSGLRRDLVKVAAGTERPLGIAIDAIVAERDLERAERAWAGFAYQEAADLLRPHLDPDRGAAAKLPSALVDRIRLAETLSRGLASWDRFDHTNALVILSPLADSVPAVAKRLPALRKLAANGLRVVEEKGKRRWLPPEDPLVPLDLWHNAERRAQRGRYDDAVARCYRLVEATAQWILWTELKVDTGAATRDRLGDALFEHLDRRKLGKPLKLGLEQALDLVRIELPCHWLTHALGPKEPDGKSSKATPVLKALIDWKDRRNDSILGHGFEPLSADFWNGKVEPWLAEHLVPQLERAAHEQGLTLAQLPRELAAP